MPAGGSWYNGEIQHYTNRTDNASVNSGILSITAKKEAFTDQGHTKQYTSARLNSKFAFKYAKVEIRAKLPTGVGTWPALWMLGKNINEDGGYWDNQGFGNKSWPDCGEIDIMELLGHEPDKVHGTAHWANPNGDRVQSGGAKALSTGDFSDEFHVFSIIWDDQNIKWYVDDVLYKTLNITPADLTEFHEEFFFIFNIAVGGEWPGNPDATTVFPQRMIVDYIRMFQ